MRAILIMPRPYNDLSNPELYLEAQTSDDCRVLGLLEQRINLAGMGRNPETGEVEHVTVVLEEKPGG